MTVLSANDEREFYRLIDRVCDQAASPDELTSLGRLLVESPEACDYYLACMELHGQLAWQIAPGREFSPVELDHYAKADAPAPADPPLVSIKIDTSAPLPTPSFFDSLFSLDTPLGSFAFSYSASAVLVGLGIFICSLIYFPNRLPSTVAENRERPAPAPAIVVSDSEPALVSVGRITGKVDCDWGDRRFAPSHDKIILGSNSKFALVSGLMEITYNTGAKVILQGPCTYEVDSASSGYLSQGKLTARVENKGTGGAGRGTGEEAVASESAESRNPEIPKSPNPSPSPQPLAPSPSALFAVRTPTAVVTDLGTEFGVEVGEAGATESLVLSGSVSIRLVSAGVVAEEETILRENDSVRVEKSAGGNNRPSLTVHRVAAVPKKYVRALPKPKPPLPVQVLAHFRLGEDDPGAAAGKTSSPRTIDRVGKVSLERHGSPGYVAADAAPGSKLAAAFTGSPSERFSGKNLGLIYTDDFILEAWVRVHQLRAENTTIVYNGHSSFNGYGLMAADGNWQFLFGLIQFWDSGVKCELDRWTHVALVRERGLARLWIDGRPAGEPVDISPNFPEGEFMIGGNPFVPTESLDGQIDEVRFSLFQGPFQPAMLLLPEKKPNASEPNPKKEGGSKSGGEK